LLGGAAQPRAAHLPEVVAERADEAVPLDAADQLGRQLAAPLLGEDLAADHFGLLVAERGRGRAREIEHVANRAARSALEDALDRLEVEPLRLEVADQLQPRNVLLLVVAGPPLQRRRRDEAARLVGADVTGGHP